MTIRNALCRRLSAAALAVALTAPGLIVAAADAGPEWAQFHGPRRDNKSDETGLLKEWPAGGPKLLWTAKGIGHGFSTVAVAGGRIYTTGNLGAGTVITALDLDGKAVWTARNGPAYKRDYPGTRSTPTLDAGRLYHQNADGDVVCLDAKTGKSVWSLNVLKKFAGRNIRWGLAESLLIDGKNVICTPGGLDAGLVALNKDTGRTVWTCKGTRDKPGYCSPIVVEHKGLRQIVTMLARSIVGVHAGSGKRLWQEEHVTYADENITMPIFHDGCIFVATMGRNARLLRLTVRGQEASVAEVWRVRALDNQHGGALLLDGYLYGCGITRRSTPWNCLEFKTGRRMYAERGNGRASPTWADGLIYAISHKRAMALIHATPKALRIVSRFDIPEGGKGPTWAHPVVCGGRLYLRHADFLYCYNVKAK